MSRQLSIPKPFGKKNTRWMSLSMAAVIAIGVVTSIPNSVVGQSYQPQLSAEQQASLAEAERLNQQVIELYNKGKYDAAIPLAERVLAIREKALGQEHPDVATSLNNLAQLYSSQGNYQQAEPLLKRSLAISEKALGQEHPLVATSLNKLAQLYYSQGNYQQAEPLSKRSLAIREKALGQEHPDVATSLNNLAQLYSSQGNYQQAEPLYKRSLAIREKALGQSHPDVATSLNNLALLYRLQGNYQQAEPLFKRSLAIREKALGQEHPYVASSLNNLALLYQDQGNYQQAEPLSKRSLAIREKALGQEHPDVATSLNNLAALYFSQGNYQQAEPLFKRSLAISDKALGQSHPDVASSLNNLAQLYRLQGNYQQAEPLSKRSLAIREKALGQEHPDVATSLNNLAALYQDQGNYQQAEPLYKRSLAIREKALGQSHPYVATSLNNLAQLYRFQGNYQQAEPLYKRSLAIREKALGQSHPDVASSLNNLAELYQDQGNYQQAEPLYKRSLAIREKALGQSHPDVASSLNNLAALYYSQGNYQQAEPLYKRSLAISDKALGQSHPDVANSLNNLAILYQAQGNAARAIDLLQRGLEIEEKNLALIFAVGSEQRKQSYMSTFTGTTNRTISLALQFARNNPRATQLALTTVLRRKGRVLDAVADSVQILRSQLANKPELKRLFDEWSSVLQQQSALVYGKKTTPQQYRDRFEQLEAQRQKLEEAISTQSAEFRNAIQPVELPAIQAKIPKDGALVEIVQYEPFNVKAKKPSEKWGAPRYAALVLRASGEPKWLDLGEASAIDKSITSLRVALSGEIGDRAGGIIPTPDAEKKDIPSLQQLARTLDKQVMEPIRPLLGDTKHVIISNDGQLTLIPFEALVDEQGKYLIQRYAFSYLTTGRDLLRFQSSANSNSAPVVFADIDYDQQQTTAAATPKSPTRGGTNRRSNDLASSIHFGRLGKTLEEAQQIKAIFSQTTILSGTQATEAAIKQLSAPSILHLATHGFFLTDQQIKPKLNNFDLQTPDALPQENPLLRSGLALAGFNDRHTVSKNADDGALTSLEVAGLDLRGTQLVVLSACETGLGDIKVGDGLYGLRRALVIAGSQSQVLSLWKVDDAGTKDLMVKYYQKLFAGKGRHEALREAQLEMLATPKYQHPNYWASFVASGDWTPL